MFLGEKDRVRIVLAPVRSSKTYHSEIRLAEHLKKSVEPPERTEVLIFLTVKNILADHS